MRILGIDPGLANTGYGVIEHTSQRSVMVTCGCIVTKADQPLPERLKQIHDELVLVIDKYRPEIACLEKLFFSVNVKSAMAVGEGRGVAILATAIQKIPLAEYTPQQIKQAVTGSGKAGKQQVERMIKVLLNLQIAPATNHAADALAVALCHAHSMKFQNATLAALEAALPRRGKAASKNNTLELLLKKQSKAR